MPSIMTDLVVVDLELLPPVLALLGLEVEGGQIHLLPANECDEVLVEKIDVDRLDVLEVEVAGLVARRLVAIHKVVVEGNADRPQSVDQQLNRQPLGECGLAGRGGPATRTTLICPRRAKIWSAIRAIFFSCRPRRF